MATVNFLYRSTKDKANLHLRLLYRFNNTDFVFGANTKIEVSKLYWNKQHKSKSKDILVTNKQIEVNSELNKIQNYIIDSFNIVNPDAVSKDWLQNQINNYYNPPQEAEAIPTELTKYIDYYINFRKHDLRNTSIQKFRTIQSKLEDLQGFRKKKILISEVDNNFKNEFIDYYKSKKYAQNTMQRELTFIKTFCRHARSLGVKTSPQLDDLRLQQSKVDKIYLSFDDLNKIENIAPDKLTDSLNNAKDWLIISCYTGQRISDFMRFDKSMIRYEKNKEGVLKPFIDFTQVKTDKVMTVALHPKVIEILDKRNGDFPYSISDQKYNDYIKVVSKIAGLTEIVKGSIVVDLNKENKKDAVKQFRKEVGMYKKYELVTSHIGRRSFATNFYGTIPTTYLINVTGHSTEAMFLNYLGKSNKDLAMELTNYF